MVNQIKYRAHEVLEQISAAKTKADRIKILQANDKNWALRDILRGTFDDVVVFLLPKGKVPFEPALIQSHPSEWTQHHKKLRYMIQGGGYEHMSTIKREKMFLDILEVIHPKDADVVVGMINKKMPYKGITKKLIQEALPGLISN